MNLQQFKYVYFIGIGGIGMSALARWFTANHYPVAGYDKTPTPLTDELAKEGIAVHFEDSMEYIPADFLKDPSKTLVIYTPAVPKHHQELNYFKDQGYTLQKRSQVLGLLTSSMFTVAVAGTHGKTTTSSMVAHVLKHAGRNCTAFLGGITQNYQTNMLLNEDTGSLDQVICVVEADEYDRSFLTLHPDIAIVTSTDADHLDIYGDKDALKQSFRDFVGQIKPGGALFSCQGLQLSTTNGKTQQEYSLKSGAYHSERLRIENAHFVFDMVTPQGVITDCNLQVPGFHNVENAIAASAVALRLGLLPDEIKAGLASYKGVRRRFEYIIKQDNLVFIDDYAHHPAEIEAFLTSVKALYPAKKLTAIFQPHLYTRTRDFADGFAKSLSLADSLVMLDIYPARELPIEGVSSQMVLDQVTISDKRISSKSEALEFVRESKPELLVTIGAGDIDQSIGLLKEVLLNTKS